ncbi:uncharacterized protein LOC107818432 isoform X1 [Nicotiana tabacum]|uniref:Uncharacterized protein LOC107818432 isoform X1 n=1 Tax=Nicotiana tabacum TaxID=4097 RepID=A0A1S4CFL0_TOBAC|nr:PREDICTED: uncharacterized protein LOC107818432 isoform X1 [Nicotiana tabacum]
MDISPIPAFNRSRFQEYYFQTFSFKKCCFFLFSFIFLIALVVVVIPSIIFLSLKPQKPVFSIQTLKVQSYKLDVLNNSGSGGLLFSSVISLTLVAQNPNKVGLRYRSTRFHVFNEGVVIGMIQVPAFYQPPCSNNLTLETRVIFYCVNVTQILSNISLQQKSSTKSVTLASILGDVAAQVKLLNVNLPKVKLAVECAINIDQNYIKLSNQVVYSVKAAKYSTLSLPMNIKGTFSNKCSASIYI